MPSFYELSELEIEILLWAVERATYIGKRPAPVFTASDISNLIARLERREVDAG